MNYISIESHGLLSFKEIVSLQDWEQEKYSGTTAII